MTFTKDEDGLIALARHLGYWPSKREVKRHLRMGSDEVGRLRRATEPRWEGPLGPNANKAAGPPAPIIIGAGPRERMTAAQRDELWARAIRESEAHMERARQKRNQSITFPAEPFAFAMLGDTHVGGAGVDYASLKADAELIRDTPGMYALFGGDATNNWIVGKLQALQRNEIMSHSSSWALFLDWIDTIGDSLAAVIVGNHNVWTAKVAGYDPLAKHLEHAAVLYDEDEIVFTLACGELEQRWKVRHKWRGSSIFNVTHGIEVGWERGDDDYDVGVGFHTHNGTLAREFVRHGRWRMAVQLGTYKLEDAYGREQGFARPPGLGRAAMVGHPDGRAEWFKDLATAAEVLGMWREKFVTE